MKHIVGMIIIGLFVGSLATLMVCAETVKFATGEWEPFTGRKIAHHGIATELVMAICKEAGISPSIEFFPWPRAEDNVANGFYFAAFPYALTEERRATFEVSEPLFYTGPKFIYYSRTNGELSSLKVSSLAELSPFSVATQSGSFFIKDLEAAGMRVYATPTMENAVKMLQAGRVDFVVEEQTATMSMIRSYFPEEIEKFKVLSYSAWPVRPNGLIVSKSYPNAKILLSQFNEGLLAIQKNGIFRQIAEKYTLVTEQ